ncbi:hypothetical protein BKA61DRAFT_159937 [Leptodontidium sp. MPI-SDFR-AT-0119]|nr:hypothetical protein BKA61DRAFT_159937 [Leptodontidium sp. MPI-SDFR-AT-0119]
MPTPDAAARSSIFSIAAANPASAFGFPNSKTTSSSVFGNTTPAPSPFGVASTSNTGPGSTSGARASNTSTGGFGAFGGFAPAKNDNTLKFPTNTSTTTTTITPSYPTRLVTFKPFIEPEPNSASRQMNCFQHISFMNQFLNFSCEELRLRDYEYDARLL